MFLLASSVVSAQDVQPTCKNCPGTYIPSEEIQAYVKRAVATGVIDQQVGDPAPLVAGAPHQDLVLLGPFEEEMGVVGPGEAHPAVHLDVVPGDPHRGLGRVGGGHGGGT